MATTTQAYKDYLTELERIRGLPNGILSSVMKKESGGNPDAVSPKGAQGAFQFMPATAKQYDINPLDPYEAAQGAARYLADLTAQYGGNTRAALAHYNGGTSQGKLVAAGKDPSFAETRDYVNTLAPRASKAINLAKLKENVQRANEAGYSSEEILAYLSHDGEVGKRIVKARGAGYSDVEILTYLAGSTVTAEPEDKDSGPTEIELLNEQLAQLDAAGNSHGPEAQAIRKQISEVAKQLNQELSRTKETNREATEGVGEGWSTGLGIGAGIGGSIAAGAVAGSLGGPLGAVLGAVVGGLGGALAGTWAGSKMDIANAVEEGQDITPEQAKQLVTDRMVETALYDAAGNVVFFGAGKIWRVLRATPDLLALVIGKAGTRTVGDLLSEGVEAANKSAKVQSALLKERSKFPQPATSLTFDSPNLWAKGSAGAQAERQISTADSQLRLLAREALDETGRRLEPVGVGGGVVTNGVFTGKPGLVESLGRSLAPDMYERNSAHLARQAETAVATFLDNISPGNVDPQALGVAIDSSIDAAERAMKAATGPVFATARGVVGDVNTGSAKAIVDGLLARNAGIGGIAVTPAERQFLDTISDRLSQPLKIDEAMDMVSAMKARLRATDPGIAPTGQARTVLQQVTKALDEAVDKAIGSTNSVMAAELKQAKKAYGDVMGMVYSKGNQALMRANPEDAGKRLFQSGNVSEIQDLAAVINQLKKTDPEQATQVARMVVRAFFDEMTPSLKDWANLGETLKTNPNLQKTWKALGVVAKGVGVQTTQVAVVEHIAQLALKSPRVRDGVMLFRGAGIGATTLSAAVGGPLAAVGTAITGFVIDKSIRALVRRSLSNPNEARKFAGALASFISGSAISEQGIRMLMDLNKVSEEEGLGTIFVGESDSTNEAN